MVLVWWKTTRNLCSNHPNSFWCIFFGKFKESGIKNIFFLSIPPWSFIFLPVICNIRKKTFPTGGIAYVSNPYGGVTSVTTKISPASRVVIRVPYTRFYILHHPSCGYGTSSYLGLMAKDNILRFFTWPIYFSIWVELKISELTALSRLRDIIVSLNNPTCALNLRGRFLIGSHNPL